MKTFTIYTPIKLKLVFLIVFHVCFCIFASLGRFVEWTPTPSMPYALSDMTATRYHLSEDETRIYIVGGCIAHQINDSNGFFICPNTTNKCAFFSFDPYDPDASETWSEDCKDAPRERYRHAAAIIGEKLYLFGGRTLMDEIIHEVDTYNIDTNTWTPAEFEWDEATSDLAAVSYNSKIYIIGGYTANYTSASSSLTVFDPDSSTPFLVLPQEMPTPRGDLSAVLLNDELFAIGGFNADNFCLPLKTVESYSFSTETWTTEPPLAIGRGDLAAAEIGGHILAIGGEDNNNCTVAAVPVDDVERLDAEQNDWVVESDIPEDRFRFVGASNGVNAVYLFGGQGFYNPKCDCFEVKKDVVKYTDIPQNSNGAHCVEPWLKLPNKK